MQRSSLIERSTRLVQNFKVRFEFRTSTWRTDSLSDSFKQFLKCGKRGAFTACSVSKVSTPNGRTLMPIQLDTSRRVDYLIKFEQTLAFLSRSLAESLGWSSFSWKVSLESSL